MLLLVIVSIHPQLPLTCLAQKNFVVAQDLGRRHITEQSNFEDRACHIYELFCALFALLIIFVEYFGLPNVHFEDSVPKLLAKHLFGKVR